MKRTAAAALVMACAGGGSASAQNAIQACADIRTAMRMTQPALIATRGGFADEDDSSVTHKSSLTVAGLGPCELKSDRDRSTYAEHMLKCSGTAADTNAAVSYIEDAYACLKDEFASREIEENHIGGRWRVTEFTGEWTEGSPEYAPLFGDDDYSSVALESQFRGSEDLNLYIWYYFLE